jgi:hypothetical protein
MLRNDQLDEAKATIALFTKGDDGVSNLFDMQCMWYALRTAADLVSQRGFTYAGEFFYRYELETAASHVRRGELGLALKNFTSVHGGHFHLGRREV